MGPAKRWLLLGLVFAAACGRSGNFRPESPDQELQAWNPQTISQSLWVRCRFGWKGPDQSQSGDAQIWADQTRVRVELSHSLAGLVLYLERSPQGVLLQEGTTGKKERLSLEEAGARFPLIGLEPAQIKALFLGRRLASQDPTKPQTEQFLQNGQGLNLSYPHWFQLNGLEIPKEILAKTDDHQLKLVVLDLELGQGEALGQ